MKLIFLGPPGAGKGTQAKLISEKFSVPHISTGDIFRKNIKEQTLLGKKAAEYNNKGLLVPDSITNAMVEKRLEEKDCKKGFILDGYPRTIPQAEFLESIQQIEKVINLELVDKEIIKRISGRRTCKNCQSSYNIFSLKPKIDNVCDKCNGELVQREDEKPEIVRKRLEVYKKQTEPLIEYYKGKNDLCNVDAYPKIADVTKQITSLIEKFK